MVVTNFRVLEVETDLFCLALDFAYFILSTCRSQYWFLISIAFSQKGSGFFKVSAIDLIGEFRIKSTFSITSFIDSHLVKNRSSTNLNKLTSSFGSEGSLFSTDRNFQASNLFSGDLSVEFNEIDLEVSDRVMSFFSSAITFQSFMI